MKPDRIVIGTDDEYATEAMRELYAPFCRNRRDRLIFMSRKSSELTKYAANSLLATKISFYPGCGYGGSCFPKDVKALIATSRENGYKAELLESVESVNDRQKHVLFAKLTTQFGEDLTGKTFAVWGLSFKPNTDDLREAPSRVLIEAIFAAGGKVRAYDPVAMKEMRHFYPNEKRLELVGTAMDTVEGCDALLINTEWREFRSMNLDHLKAGLKQPIVIDGRNLYEPAQMREAGFHYECIGRPDMSGDEIELKVVANG